jgi:hypothetical protein
MMAKFVLILYVPGIPALSMSDIDFDFGGVWPSNFSIIGTEFAEHSRVGRRGVNYFGVL